MNTLFLHVGPHKTGTTLLQKFCLDNQAELFKSNLVYPKRYINIFGHHAFRDLLDKEALNQDDIAFFHEQHNFLLSSEDFISLGKQKFEYLRNTLSQKNIVVLFSWRRASLKMYSIWQETIKHGATESFYSYYHNHLARPSQSQMLSADLKLNMFSQVFGRENLQVLDYDASAQNNSLIEDFIDLMGLEWSNKFVRADDNANAANRSMDFTDIEVIRVLNHIFKLNYAKVGSWVRLQYAKNSLQLEQAGLSRLKTLIAKYETELTVGNYFIDNRCEKIMLDKFQSNIKNYKPVTSNKKIRLASEEWIYELEAQSILRDLAATLNRADV